MKFLNKLMIMNKILNDEIDRLTLYDLQIFLQNFTKIFSFILLNIQLLR